MNYANLIQNITENIKTNGSQAITAQVLQDVLVDMVGELGQSGALLGGVIDTSFVPDPTNDAQVVYIAESPGTYTNFNGLVVGAGEVAFFYFDGNAWAKSSVDVLEVVNDLNSTATDKALSAAMGKQLQDSLTQAVNDLTTAIGNKADRQTTEQALNTLQNQINDKADTSYVNSQLATKADTATVNAALANKADKTYVDNQLATKADASQVTADLADKIDKVHDAEVGNVPMFKADGGIEDGGVAADNIAEQDGYYETMVVGGAENLIGSDIVSSQFTRRKTGGSTDVGTGVAILKTIKGNTLVWNQLFDYETNYPNLVSVPAAYTASSSVDSTKKRFVLTSTSTETGSVGNSSLIRGTSNVTAISGHKYLVAVNIKTFSTAVQVFWGDAVYTRYTTTPGSFTRVTFIRTGAGGSDKPKVLYAANGGTWNSGETVELDYFEVFDLTQMGLDTLTVAEFEALFPLNYYAYNTGSLLNLTATGLQTNGFNQWDEEWEVGNILPLTGQTSADASRIRSKNYIPVFGGQTYYFYNGQNKEMAAYAYDIDKNFIGVRTMSNTWEPASSTGNVTGNAIVLPSNCAYLKFRCVSSYGTTYKNDICINLSDVNKNGTYEPYWSETKVLPITTATSGGVAIFPDGMKSAGTAYDETDGVKAVKRIGSRAYQAGDESDTSVKTDGTTTYYALPTPTEYTLDTPFNGQYKVDNDGTETILPENTSTPTTSPIVADINYALNAIDTIRNLPQNYISKASMDAILTAFKTAGVITNYTLTWDATNQKYNCSITV